MARSFREFEAEILQEGYSLHQLSVAGSCIGWEHFIVGNKLVRVATRSVDDFWKLLDQILIFDAKADQGCCEFERILEPTCFWGGNSLGSLQRDPGNSVMVGSMCFAPGGMVG